MRSLRMRSVVTDRYEVCRERLSKACSPGNPQWDISARLLPGRKKQCQILPIQNDFQLLRKPGNWCYLAPIRKLILRDSLRTEILEQAQVEPFRIKRSTGSFLTSTTLEFWLIRGRRKNI